MPIIDLQEIFNLFCWHFYLFPSDELFLYPNIIIHNFTKEPWFYNARV